MNLTELARILKITPSELKQYMPQMGFDIGYRAIKIDKPSAKKIIAMWPQFKRRMEIKKAAEKREEAAKIEMTQTTRKISIPKLITVKQFSELSNIPVNKLVAQLMKNGVFASLNEKIDFDTASIIGTDFGVEVSLDKGKEEVMKSSSTKLKEIIAKESDDNLQPRPPVIVVMGHVDHGKTMLLDAIRKTDIIATEAGGITQNIGAYQVNRRGRSISFIDTPGHEAFTAMRNRGAKVADIAILVVAADDGVKPQTIEAFRIIEAANIPFIVAINKIDKPGADINNTKQELSNKLNIIPEDWGGKVVCVPISAKENKNIDELLDMVLLAADIAEDSLKANPLASATGTVVESNVDKGVGVIATVLVQNGTLHVGDSLVCNNKAYGKVRALKNYLGHDIKEAGPSTPAKVIGFKVAPEVGDIVEVGKGERIKKTKLSSNVLSSQSTSASSLSTVSEEEDVDSDEQINLVIKSNTLGSGEAIEASLAKIDTLGVKIKIIHKGLGNITEGDVSSAKSSNAKLIGFSVQISPQIAQLAREEGVEIKNYSIIYELLNDLKDDIQNLAKPEIKRIDLGRIKVKAIFKTGKKEQIIGGQVTKGIVKPDSLVEVIRDEEIIAIGKLAQLQSGKQDVDMVENGSECGLKYQGPAIIEVDDRLEVYQEEKIYQKVK